MTVKLAITNLLWGNPHSDDFAPWLTEVKAADDKGVAGSPAEDGATTWENRKPSGPP